MLVLKKRRVFVASLTSRINTGETASNSKMAFEVVPIIEHDCGKKGTVQLY